jgi:hypothetical protein
LPCIADGFKRLIVGSRLACSEGSDAISALSDFDLSPKQKFLLLDEANNSRQKREETEEKVL